jgi:hypothetical protein
MTLKNTAVSNPIKILSASLYVIRKSQILWIQFLAAAVCQSVVLLAKRTCTSSSRSHGLFPLTSNRNSSSRYSPVDTIARMVHVIERIEHLLAIELFSHVHCKVIPDDRSQDTDPSVRVEWPRSQPQVETIDKTIASKQHTRARIRCLCLPGHETACTLLGHYVQMTGSRNVVIDAPTLDSILEIVYAQLSRAEKPDLLQLSLLLSIFATGVRYEKVNDRTTLCSRYWQMTALYILAEQRQASSLRSVEVLQTVLNILLLMRDQQGPSETFHKLHALGMSLSAQTSIMDEDQQTGTVDLETKKRLRCQIGSISL